MGVHKMGRLNRKLDKKISKGKQPAVGLSNSAAKSLVDIKDTIKIVASTKESAPAPTSDVVTFTKHVEKIGKEKQPGADGRKMRIRTEMLTKKLKQFETDKQESKAKKIREKVVIVKDVKPLVDELEEIEEEIRNEDLDKKMKEKNKKKKPT